jgi:predicted peptidase
MAASISRIIPVMIGRPARVLYYALAAALLASMPAAAQVPVLPPGVTNQTLGLAGAPPVHYAMSIPAGYTRTTPVPLILALHFGGDPNGAGRAMLDILIAPALGELGAIIVAPDSAGGGWNTAQNEMAVNALLAAVEKSYNVDLTRVIVTGFSMGGAGTWYWAGKYPDRFSAAIPVSGRPTSGAWRVPVFAVHSRDDQTVPIGPAERRITELQQQGVNARMVVLRGIQHYETYKFVNGLRQAVPWIQEVWKRR